MSIVRVGQGYAKSSDRSRVMLKHFLAVIFVLGVATIGLFFASVTPLEFVRANQPFAHETVGEIMPGQEVSQEFVAVSDGLSAVEVLISTVGRRNDCTLVFTLHDVTSGVPLVKLKVPASELQHNAFRRFEFPEIANSGGRRYAFTLESPDGVNGRAVTVYATNWALEDEGALVVGGKVRPGTVTFKTSYRAASALSVHLDRLTWGKPGIWGTGELYLGLGLACAVSFALLVVAILRRQHGVAVALTLTLTLLLSLAYAGATAPWHVVDEPDHFAFSRKLWREARGEDSSLVESEVLRSVARFGWFQIGRNAPPRSEPKVLAGVASPQWGIEKRHLQPPSYYQLGALALHVTGEVDPDRQLYVVRALSSLLGVAVVALAYLAARLLVPGDRTAAVTIAAVVALLPERAFIAGAVNNDNLAILAASAAFLACVRLLVRGFSARRGLALLVASALLPFTKATALAMVSAPALLGLGGIFRIVGRRWSSRRTAATALAGLAFIGLALALSLESGDAWSWARAGAVQGLRTETTGPAGRFALTVRDDSVEGFATATQRMPPDVAKRLRGQVATLGTWVRSEADQQPGYAQLFDGTTWHTVEFTATPEWAFVATSFTVSPEARDLVVNLVPTDPIPEARGAVQFAGVLLVEGDHAGSGAPALLDGGRQVSWGVHTLVNLVDNASGAKASLRFKGAASAALEKLRVPVPLTAVQRLLDPDSYRVIPAATHWEYLAVFIDSFWARFGYGGVRLPAPAYVALRTLTVASLLGFLWLILQPHRGRSAPSAAGPATLGLVLAVVLFGFAMTLLRGVPGYELTHGRYALPVVVPFAVVLFLGIRAICPRPLHHVVAPAMLVGLFALNAASLLLAVIPAGYHW